MSESTIKIVAGATLLVILVAAITALAWHGTLTGAETLASFSTIIGISGGGLAVHAGVSAGASAAHPTRKDIP